MERNQLVRVCNLLCLLFILFIVSSCQKKDIDVIGAKDDRGDLSVKQAKEWFINKYEPAIGYSNARTNSEFTKIIKWNEAFDYTGPLKRQIVVVPVIHKRKGVPTGNKQLWIYNNEDGESHVMIAEYIHDRVDMSVAVTNKFSGLLLLKDWNDYVLGGYRIKDDNIVDYVQNFEFDGEGSANGKRGARLSYEQCYLAPICRLLHVEFLYNGQIGRYTTSLCEGRITCVYQDFPGAQHAPVAPHWIPIPSTYGGGAPPNFDFFPNDYKSETNPDKCAGLNRMWDIGYRGNDPILTKEVTGFLTADNKIIIAPTAPNTATTAHISSEYYDREGRKIIDFDWESHRLITINYQLNLRTEHYIVATIHTHPYVNSPVHPDKVPSAEDREVARSLAGYKHYIRHSSGYMEYNLNGQVGPTTIQDCQ